LYSNQSAFSVTPLPVTPLSVTHGIAAVRVIDFDHCIQRAEEVFRTIQWVDVRLGRSFMEHFIGIEHTAGTPREYDWWQIM